MLLSACAVADTDPEPEPRPTGTIAFVSDRSGNDELYLHRLGDGTEARLTDSPGFDRAPAWNPDGSLLAFNSRREPHADRPQIYLLDPATLDVTRAGDSEAEQHRAAFDPSGQQLYFQQGVFFVEAFNLIRLDLDSGATEAVTTATNPQTWSAAASPSPDGAWLAFQSNAHLADPSGPFPQVLHVIALPDGEAITIAFEGSPLDGASVDGPAWAPDASRLAFSSGGRLWLVNVAGNAPQAWMAEALTDGPDHSSPAFSPDGHYLAFQVDIEAEEDHEEEEDVTLIAVLDLETGEWFELTEGRTPAWTAREW